MLRALGCSDDPAPVFQNRSGGPSAPVGARLLPRQRPEVRASRRPDGGGGTREGPGKHEEWDQSRRACRTEGSPCPAAVLASGGHRLAQGCSGADSVGTAGTVDGEERGEAGGKAPKGRPELVQDAQQGGHLTRFLTKGTRKELTLFAERKRKNCSYKGSGKDVKKEV